MATNAKMVGKKAHKNKPVSKKYKMFKIEGGKVVRERSCPRCGPGVFLMKASNRLYCGRCHFTEFIKKSEEVGEVAEKVEGSN